MLEYFPCTVDKSIKESERSKDNSVREPDDLKLKAKDEKPDTTKAHGTSHPKDRGRRTKNTSEDLPRKPGVSPVKPKNEKPNTNKAKKESPSKDRGEGCKKTDTKAQSTLLSISHARSAEIKTKDLKGEDSRHIKGEKMDTSAKVAEGALERERNGTAKNAADRKGKEQFRKLN